MLQAFAPIAARRLRAVILLLLMTAPGCVGQQGSVRQSASDPAADAPDDPGPSRERERDGLVADYPDAPKPFLFSGIRELLQTDDADGSEDGEAGISRMRPRSDPRINIRAPDPDTANFPNSAFTIPQGRVYLETSPLSLYAPVPGSGRIYNWEFLMRYGFTDWLEFRLFSNGYTSEYTEHITTGFSPLTFDLKMHLWDENRKYWLPAAGFEVYIETQMGSKAFGGGTQPSINMLFDQNLPLGLQLEYNVGMAGGVDLKGATYYQLASAWAIQRAITKDFAIFTHSFQNTPSLPRFGASLIA